MYFNTSSLESCEKRFWNLLSTFFSPLIVESHDSGVADGENAFNNRQWRENPAMQFWRSHKPAGSYLVFSNEPDGIAFHSQHAAQPAPRRRSGPYASEDLPLSRYETELFGSGEDAYLVWIEPNPYDHYYGPEELAPIAVLEPLFNSDTGSVYELQPMPKE